MGGLEGWRVILAAQASTELGLTGDCRDMREATHQLHCAIPRGRYELVFVYIGPVDGEDFARVLVPGTNRKVLYTLAILGMGRTVNNEDNGDLR